MLHNAVPVSQYPTTNFVNTVPVTYTVLVQVTKLHKINNQPEQIQTFISAPICCFFFQIPKPANILDRTNPFKNFLSNGKGPAKKIADLCIATQCCTSFLVPNHKFVNTIPKLHKIQSNETKISFRSIETKQTIVSVRSKRDKQSLRSIKTKQTIVSVRRKQKEQSFHSIENQKKERTNDRSRQMFVSVEQTKIVRSNETNIV